MEPTSEGAVLNKSIMKETVPVEKHVMHWIAAKPLSEQEQSVHLL